MSNTANTDATKENFSQTDAFDERVFLRTLTSHPGVYRMLDAAGKVLYVGKARNLKKRVSSYFRSADQHTPKTRALMSHTLRVEVTVTHTETEALLLENNLIKEHRPRYNVLLRDDKSFPYIYFTTHERFPRLAFHRGAKSGQGRYFGPYASAGSVRETLTQLQKLFRIRQCEDSFFKNRSRPCLQHQIERCTAPCVDLVDEKSYAEDVRHAVMFLEGRSEEMIGELVERMSAAAQSLRYELAGQYRDQISSLRRIQERQYINGAQGNIDIVAACAEQGVAVVSILVVRNGQSLGSKSVLARHASGADAAEVLAAFLPQYYLSKAAEQNMPSEILIEQSLDDIELLSEALSEHAKRRVSIRQRVRGERKRWLEMARHNASLAVLQRVAERANLRVRFEALRDVLELSHVPERLECFDISHTAGEATVASCVVFGLEGALKSDYRRFNIRDTAPGDDYGAMREALKRRYMRVQKEEGRLPDLLIVDGGKGQLTQAKDVLAELKLEHVRLLGVAKGPSRRPGLESLFLPERDAPLHLSGDNAALHLIQQIRDEAHRFAITGHRTRRKRARGASVLEDIPGVGPKRRQRLLREFGGLQALARAGVEDLCRVSGVNRALAQAIYEAFRDAP